MSTFVRKVNQNLEALFVNEMGNCAIEKFRSAETIIEHEEFIAAVKLLWFPSNYTGENEEFLVDL